MIVFASQSSVESSCTSPTASKGVVPPLGRTKLSVSLRQTRSSVPHARRTSAASLSAACWCTGLSTGRAQGYPQPHPQLNHRTAGHICRTNVKPPACCHPPSPCEWRPTGGFDAPTLGVSSQRRQRCVGAGNIGLWTRLWAGWGRAGVFLWTGRDRAVHASRWRDAMARATCADGARRCGRERNRWIWVGRKAPAQTHVHGVDSLVQVSDAGGTVPAWLL